MARARNIKPGFYKNEDLAECSVWARFIFPGLWMLADRDGRLEDRPKRIKAELLPFDTQDVEPLLRDLAEKRDSEGVPFIVRYQIDGVRYIQISKFSKHQTPHYSEKHSVIKPPTFRESEPHIDTQNSGSTPENSGSDQGLKGGSQPPDSLNPDSPTTESGLSDSLNPSSTGSNLSGSTAPPTRTGQIALLLRRLAAERRKTIRIKAIDSVVNDWADRGISDEHIIAAFADALQDREFRRDASAITPGFIDVFLVKVLNPHQQGSRVGQGGQSLDWWADNAGIFAKAAEEGVEVATRLNADEEEVRDSRETLARLCVKLGAGPWIDERNATLMRRIAELRDVSPEAEHLKKECP